ncbi:MAG: hypothetical protein RBT57_02875 [Paludibacter sp.]|nr:hypothetical protein [Paludibacter sp.]
MQPGNEGKNIEDYFIFLQNPAYEAGVTAVEAAQIALSAKQASEEAQAGSVAAMEKSDDFANEAEDVEVEPEKFSSKHFSIKSGKSANLSQKWANEAEDVPVEGGEFSAKHYSLKAAAEKQEAVSAKEAAELAKTESEAARDTALNTVNDVRETGEKNSVAIATLENVINSANINQELTATATGVDTVALPKTAANTGMQVQLFGQSAENLVVNGDFRNGTTGWGVDGDAAKDVSTGRLVYTAVYAPHVLNRTLNFVAGNKYYFYIETEQSAVGSSTPKIMVGYFPGINSATALSMPNVIGLRKTSGIYTASGAFTNFRVYTYVPSGQTVAFDNIRIIDLTATFGAGNEPTKEVCDALFANYFEGTDNVFGTGRVRCVGKNIFDKSIHSISSGYYGADGGVLGSSSYRRISTYIPVVQNTTYYDGGARVPALHVIFYDKNKFFIGSEPGQSGGGKNTFTTPVNCAFVRTCFPGTAEQVENIINTYQIGRGTLATNYEPFRQSSLYLTTTELRSNALIKDEIRKGANGYELVKRVGVGTLTEKITQPINFLTGYQVRENTVVNDSDTFTTTGNGGLQFNGVIAGKWYKLSISGTSTAETFGVYSTGGVLQTLLVGFNGTLYVKPDYSNIYISNRGAGVADITSLSLKEVTTVEAIAATSTFTELGSNIHYTLATPVITPIAHAGLLNSNSNGTAYFEPIIADAGVYASNIAVQLTDYPISSLERIVKRVNGADVELSTATAVIAGNGLSFTHPNLASGDLVMFTYAYNKESICRSMTLTHYDSRFVIADTANSKVYRWRITSTNGVASIALTEV